MLLPTSLTQALSGVQHPVALLTSAGRIVWNNQAATPFLGTACTCSLQNLVEQEPSTVEPMLKRWRRTSAPLPAKLSFLRAKGSSFRVHGHALALETEPVSRCILLTWTEQHDMSRRFTALSATVTRLSDEVQNRRIAESRYRQLSRELEDRVEERTRALAKANQDLQTALDTLRNAQDQLVQSEKLAALGSLVAGVAHEVNTPIGIGVTATSHLSEQVKRATVLFEEQKLTNRGLATFLVEAKEATEITQTNLARAADLVRSFRRVASDQQSVKRERYQLRSYIEEVLRSLGPRLKKTRQKINVLPGPEVEILGRPGTISQIISNLVLNSLLHAYDERDDGTLSISIQAQSGAVELVFSDDGRGMNAETLAHIFEPFFTTSRSTGGTGLGLHIVHNLVRGDLGGEIECKSEPERGTIFRISFPQETRLEVINDAA